MEVWNHWPYIRSGDRPKFRSNMSNEHSRLGCRRQIRRFRLGVSGAELMFVVSEPVWPSLTTSARNCENPLRRKSPSANSQRIPSLERPCWSDISDDRRFGHGANHGRPLVRPPAESEQTPRRTRGGQFVGGIGGHGGDKEREGIGTTPSIKEATPSVHAALLRCACAMGSMRSWGGPRREADRHVAPPRATSRQEGDSG